MELEFDKEIDAILRKARGGGVVDAVKTAHIDADAVAAFAENALPEKARALYMEHFADCGRCRGLLAQAIPWPPAEPKTASVAAPVTGDLVPWYSKLFRTPNLAMAMGALVLVFGGVLAFLVFKQRTDQSNGTLSQVMDSEKRPGGPSDAEVLPITAANANAALSANTANSAANTGTNESQKAGSTGEPGTGRGPANEPSATTSGRTAETVAPAEPPRVGAAPPPPPVAAVREQPSDDERERKDKDDGVRDEKTARSEDRSATRDAAPASKKAAGPGVNRSAGPRQNKQEQMNQQAVTADQVALGSGAMTASTVKTAGGKKFENRDGAWYDTAYRGQATKNISRSSEEYWKLDSGLRSIASSVGGVVVVVWKGTAYRIQ